MEDDFTNIFEEEYDKIAESKTYTVLSDVLKISLLDDNNEFRISLSHIRKNITFKNILPPNL